jgi:preprotein translocase subunit YajC
MKAFLLNLLVWTAPVLADTPPATAPGPANPVSPFIPLIIIFGIFYFLILRPQQKKAKEQAKFLSELKKGDLVVTNSGIIGTIKMVADKFVTLEIDQGVQIKMLRSHILEGAGALKDKEPAKKVTAPQTQE